MHTELSEVLRDIFREEALLIGGLAISYEMSDELVWALCRNLDALRVKFLNRLEPASGSTNGSKPRLRLKPHPAVQELLRRLRD